MNENDQVRQNWQIPPIFSVILRNFEGRSTPEGLGKPIGDAP
jgi:hypothetical protein